MKFAELYFSHKELAITMANSQGIDVSKKLEEEGFHKDRFDTAFKAVGEKWTFKGTLSELVAIIPKQSEVLCKSDKVNFEYFPHASFEVTNKIEIPVLFEDAKRKRYLASLMRFRSLYDLHFHLFFNRTSEEKGIKETSIYSREGDVYNVKQGVHPYSFRYFVFSTKDRDSEVWKDSTFTLIKYPWLK